MKFWNSRWWHENVRLHYISAVDDFGRWHCECGRTFVRWGLWGF